MKRRNIAISVLVALAAFAWAFGEFPTGDPIPAVDCPFEVGDVEVQVTCFQVPVSSGTVLATVLHRGSQPLEVAPVLMLGPDHAATPSFDIALYAQLPLLEHRDIVLVDPIGTEHTAPTSECDEDLVASDIDSVLRCRERLLDADHFDLWGTDQHVDHLALVRSSLAEGRPWRRWHVVARGAGGQLAMRLAASDASGVSTVVLSSPQAYDEPSFLARARSFAPTLTILEMLCETDGGCTDFEPISASTERVARRLAATPEPVEVRENGNRVLRSIDDADFQRAVSYALETPTLPEILPWAVERIEGGGSEFGLSQGARDTLAGLISAVVPSPTVDPMMWWHLTCTEQLPHVDPAPLDEATTAALGLVAPADVVTVCGDWPAGQPATDPPEVDPLAIDRPVLFITSDLDPITTAESVSVALAAFEDPMVARTTVVEWMPGATTCSTDALETFFEDPRQPPVAGCLTEQLALTAHPVPVGTIRQIGSLGESGAMAMGTLASLIAIVIGLWIQLDHIGTLGSILWRVGIALNTWAFLGVAVVLVNADEPARILGQPWWSWVFFGMPWIVVLVTAGAITATFQEIDRGAIGGRWPPRMALAGVGIVGTFVAMVLLGVLPGT